MNYQETAAKILPHIGGRENIVNLEHCSTRLRFTVADKGKVDAEALKSVPGVLQVIINSQVQVVIGNDVIEVYEELLKTGGFDQSKSAAAETPAEKKTVGNLILEYLVGIFQPLIPAIAGAGILKSILILLLTLGLMTKDSDIYKVFISISNATFYFMPMMVAVTTATKLNTNKMVAVSAVGVLLLPDMSKMLAEGLTFAGLGLKSIAYSSQVFPAILTTLFLGLLEKQLNKVTPKVIRTFFVPMAALAVTIPVALMLLGPLGFVMGEGLATVIMFMYAKFGLLAVALVAGILPLMVSTGMHKAMIPYVVSSLGTVGYEILYNSASLAHNISEAGACLAIALKSKDENEKSVAASAGISALMGITEPALYGVTLQNKIVLKAVMASSAITGAFLGFVGLKAFVAVGPGLASITMFVDMDNSMNFVYAIMGLLIAMSLSFIFTLLLWKSENKTEDSKETEQTATDSTAVMVQPVPGKIIPLAEVKDDMFAGKLLGDGVGIIPAKGELHAPCDGTVTMVYDTKHAIGFRADNGTEILFHVGINTVELEGKFFEPQVSEGTAVKKGDLLLEFSLANIEAAGYDCTTIFIVTNMNDFDVKINDPATAEKDQVIMTSERIEAEALNNMNTAMEGVQNNA